MPYKIIAQTNVLDDISQYKDWLRDNFPHPEDLSWGELFYEAAKAVYFGQREPEILQLLEYIDENLLNEGDFYDTSLRDYIHWISSNSNDSFLKYRPQAMKAIANAAISVVGERNINYVRCQYFFLLSDKLLRDITSDFDCLISLQQRNIQEDNSLENKELLCQLKFSRATIEPYVDNPLTYDDIFSALALMGEINEKEAHAPDSFEKAILYNSAANALLNISQECEASISAKKYLYCKRQLDYKGKTDLTAMGRHLMKRALETIDHLYSKCHPIRIWFLTDYNNSMCNLFFVNNSNLKTAQYIYEFITYYYPYDSLETYLGLIDLWRVKHCLSEGLEDSFKIPIVKREIIKKGSLSISLLTEALSNLLKLSVFYDRTSFKEMAKEFCDLTKIYYSDSPLKTAYLIFKVFVEIRQYNAQIDENYLLPAINEYLFNSEPSAFTINFGHDIFAFLKAVYEIDGALRVQKKICEETAFVYGLKSEIYFNEEINKILIQTQIEPVSAKSDFETIIFKIRDNNLNPIPALNRYANFLYYDYGDLDSAQQLYEELIKECETQNGDEYPLSVKAWCYLNYLTLLQKKHSDFQITESLFLKAKKILDGEIDSTAFFISNYEIAATYLEKTGRYNEALNLLDLGLGQNDSLFDGELDGEVVSLYVKKIEILSKYLNRMAEAQALINDLISSFDWESCSYLNKEVLQCLYALYLAKPYGNNFELRYSLLSQMVDMANRLYLVVQDKIDFELGLRIPIYTQCINLQCEQFEQNQLRVQNLKINYPDLYQTEKELLEERAQPDKTLVNFIKSLTFNPRDWLYKENLKPVYRMNMQGLIRSIARYYDVVEHDGDKTLFYTKEYAESLKDMPLLYALSICDLGYRCLKYSKLEDADKYIKESIDLIKDIKFITPQDRLAFNLRIGSYYLNHCDYDNFLPFAREKYAIMKEILDRNYQTLSEDTQNLLLEIYGDPSIGLKALLPVMPEELSSEMYDATLFLTGLQLRSLKKRKEVFHNSKDVKMISLIDSINYLRSQYDELQIYNDLNWNSNALKEKQRLYTLIQQLEERFIDMSKETLEDVKNEIHWQDVRNALNEEDLALEYVFARDRLMALVLKRNSIHPIVVNLCQLEEFCDCLRRVQGMSDHKAKALYTDKVVNLFKFIWEPLTPHLDGVRNVYFTMPGLLSTLSLGAVSDSNGEFIIDKYNLFQLTSTAEVVNKNKKTQKSTKPSALLVGGVFYSDYQKDDYISPKKLKSILLGNSGIRPTKEPRGISPDVFGYLPYTEFEIYQIKKTIKKGEWLKCVKDIRGNKANERNVRSLLSKKNSIIHFATHGFFIAQPNEVYNIPFYRSRYGDSSIESMERAGLALSGAELAWLSDVDNDKRDDKGDGILTAKEISLLDLAGTELAVLSACETSLGDYNTEGVFGLPRGFKMAGVKSLIVSLWNVNDMSTALLMSEFYSCLAKDQSYNTAWKNSIKILRQKFPEPVYWGGFTMLDCLE